MKDNSLNIQNPTVVSSGHVRVTMQPTLRKMMAMTVINDNGNAQVSARKQIWFVGVGLLVALVVTVLY
jgi:hypothetical protein